MSRKLYGHRLRPCSKRRWTGRVRGPSILQALPQIGHGHVVAARRNTCRGGRRARNQWIKQPSGQKQQRWAEVWGRPSTEIETAALGLDIMTEDQDPALTSRPTPESKLLVSPSSVKPFDAHVLSHGSRSSVRRKRATQWTQSRARGMSAPSMRSASLRRACAGDRRACAGSAHAEQRTRQHAAIVCARRKEC